MLRIERGDAVIFFLFSLSCFNSSTALSRVLFWFWFWRWILAFFASLFMRFLYAGRNTLCGIGRPLTSIFECMLFFCFSLGWAHPLTLTSRCFLSCGVNARSYVYNKRRRKHSTPDWEAARNQKSQGGGGWLKRKTIGRFLRIAK